MTTTTTLLQAVIAVLQWGSTDLASALRQFGINTREGMVMTRVITWTRSHNTDPYVKKDVKGRLLVAQKYRMDISWGFEGSKLKVIPGIIQVNVLKSRSKRGGWLIRVHKQTPVLSQKTLKFVFCNHWEGYWASDEMISAHLVAKAKNGKLSTAAVMDNVFGRRLTKDIINNISLLEDEMSR